jgi:hypothetical protein
MINDSTLLNSNKSESSIPSAQSPSILPLIPLQEILHNRIIHKKGEMQKCHNKACIYGQSMDRDRNNPMGIGANTNSYKKNATSAEVTMVIGIPILLILSTIAISSSVFTAQLVYSQGPPARQQQQGLNDLIFQTTNVTVDGINYPIKYNITNGAAKLVSTVAEKESVKLIMTIAPTKDGKLTIILPRNVTDYKIAGGKDGMFVVNINAKQTTNFQEISNNRTARELEINFGKDDRVIEIIGTQMGQGDIATVKEEEATDITSPPLSPNTTNMTENVRNNNASPAAGGDNASQTGESIVNQTGEAAQTFVNQTASALGNVSGEVSELFGANK